MIGAVLDVVLDAIGSDPITYLVLWAIVLVDDFVFFAPGDTAMITAGIVAANGELSIWLVVLAGTVGGICGDNVFYWLGRRFGPALAERLLRGRRTRDGYEWARTQLLERGAAIIVAGRFIPGLRTATTFAAGVARLGYRRFLVADTFAAASWATYTALLGYVGGATFEDSFWPPLLIGVGLAIALGVAVELATAGWRRARRD